MSIVSKILGSGYTTIVCAVMAVIVGVCFPDVGMSFIPLSDMFLTLISISIIPIIFSSVTCSVIQMLTSKLNSMTVPKIIMIFFSALVFSGVVGLVVSVIFSPGTKVMESKVISDMIFQDVQRSIQELSIYEPLDSLKKFSLLDFFAGLFPKNPFKAFADGNVLQVLTLSILVGTAIAHTSLQKRSMAIKGLSVAMQAFKNILKLPTKILPLGMFFLISSNLAKINLDDINAMQYFCVSALVGFLLLVVIAIVLIATYSPLSLPRSIASLKETIIVAFSTCSNQATLPFLITTLIEKLKLPKSGVELAIPLGITMCRVSNAMYYAFVAVFIASIYNEPLSFFQYGFIVLGSIMTSFATSGVSGVIAIGMISMILDPLNLPVESILVFLIAVDPIINPFRTVSSLLMNAALSCLILNKDRRSVCA